MLKWLIEVIEHPIKLVRHCVDDRQLAEMFSVSGVAIILETACVFCSFSIYLQSVLGTKKVLKSERKNKRDTFAPW